MSFKTTRNKYLITKVFLIILLHLFYNSKGFALEGKIIVKIENKIITNLDIEHMDFYKSKKNLINAFEKFINLLPFYGTTIMCYDDMNLKLLINKIKNRNIFMNE